MPPGKKQAPGRAPMPPGKEPAGQALMPPGKEAPGRRGYANRGEMPDIPPPTTNSNPAHSTLTLGEMATKNPPGRTTAARPRQPASFSEYEKERAQHIMRNNQIFQRLGIGQLASLLKNVPQKSGSEYSPHDNEGLEDDDEVISKSVKVSSQGTRGSKRVTPPRLQLERRVTRQNSAATISLTASTEEALATVQTENLNPTADEDELVEVTEQVRRGRSMGKDLDRITRGLGSKICIHVSEGKRRPAVPLQAAKLASEAGIVLRQHEQFNMDTDNKTMKDACIVLLKGGQRQRRYNLKLKYFNGLSQDQVPRTSPVAYMSDAQWLELVAMWSKEEHKVLL
ncbi:hypothetical protein PAHAL_7G050900 [Panicum hallii]|uniref:Uncharacterized protein n=1 Tax=Panicum hallii TaxID=206008 RepID=A0A2T8IB28_9POAL|nr:hypothetical protein PAHAL_7G050900 [Panicum hallii]